MENFDTKKTGNMELHTDKGYAIIHLNLTIFSHDVINTTISKLSDKINISVNANLDKITLKLVPKFKEENIEMICRMFNNELIKCAFEKLNEDKIKAAKNILLSSQFSNFTNILNNRKDSTISEIEENLSILENLESDPLGISNSW